jgi:uncharacterized membrane protein
MILVILVLGFLVRLITLNQSLWLDESINVLAAKNLPFWHFVTSYPVGDFHPPLYFGILWIWGHLFGFSEISVRMPSVIFGVATIYLTFLLGKELYNKKIGLVSALFIALNPMLVYYSQETRMYSLSAFSVVLCCYFFIKLLKGKKYLWFYSLSVLPVLYSEYLAYFILPAQLLVVLWLERKKWKSVLGGMLLGGIPFIPWLFIFPKQLMDGIATSHAVPGWAAVVGKSSFKELALIFIKGVWGRVTFANKIVYGILTAILAIFYSLIIFRPLKRLEKPEKILLIFIVLPVGLAFVVSFFIPILSYFRMLFVLPFVYILVAKGASILSPKFSKLAFGGVIFISFLSLLAYYLNPNFQREDWRDLSNFLNSQSNSENLVLFENNDLPSPFQYYDSGKIESLGALSHFPANNQSDVADLKEITQGKNKIFLVDYLVQISDPNREVDQTLVGLGFKVTKVNNFPGVGFVYEYTH